jgi:erythromycin esterase-like protein
MQPRTGTRSPGGARSAGQPLSALQRELAVGSEPLPAIDDEAFGACFDRFGDSRVVLIGEATHGTSEFYRARAALTRRLVTHHGFNIVALEADWPDAAAVDRYVRDRPRRPHAEPVFTRFPQWMWRNLEVDEFVQWLHGFNAQRPAEERVELRGLDIYSLHSSSSAVIEYLDRTDPRAAAEARRRYGCLTPWQDEPASYGRDVLRGEPDCEGAVVAQLRELLDARLQRAATDGEELFEAAQNARLVRAAESYYRVMYQGARESWNLRDRHMFETLERSLERRGPRAKAVVWAHNSHIGDAAATEMGARGEINIGHLCRQRWPGATVLIGQGTDRGTVIAADDWGEPARVKSVVPSREDSWERQFLDTGLGRALTDWRERPELQELLAAPRLERAIGVIYRPDSERASHYFEAHLGKQFDAWLWFEDTLAVTPLSGDSTSEAPDTWPSGL